MRTMSRSDRRPVLRDGPYELHATTATTATDGLQRLEVLHRRNLRVVPSFWIVRQQLLSRHVRSAAAHHSAKRLRSHGGDLLRLPPNDQHVGADNHYVARSLLAVLYVDELLDHDDYRRPVRNAV